MKYYCSILYRFHLIISIILISSYLKAGGSCNNQLSSAGYVTVHNKTDIDIEIHPVYYFYNRHTGGDDPFTCQKFVDANGSIKIYWEYPFGVNNRGRMRVRHINFLFKKTDPKSTKDVTTCDVSTDGAEGKLTHCNKTAIMGFNNNLVQLQFSNTCGTSDSNKRFRECDLYIEGHTEEHDALSKLK